jgi:Core-2/I-Branching enzyme
VQNQPLIAYLITSHNLPDQVLRLAGVLRSGSPESEIVVHHDERASRLDHTALAAYGVRAIDPPSRVTWGEISHLTAMLRCFSWLLTESNFDWMVLLSGQDYPIRPLGDIERDLSGTSADGLIEAEPCPKPGLSHRVDEFALRYHFQWYRSPRWMTGRIPRSLASRTAFVRSRFLPRSGAWVGARALSSPFDESFRCYRGSDWFTLSRRAVRAVVSFSDANPEILAHYSRTLIPTESYVQTVLANDANLRLLGDHRRYVVWDQPVMTGPRILRSQDLGALLASGRDFARKFDETVDRDVLDMIDQQVHSCRRPARRNRG